MRFLVNNAQMRAAEKNCDERFISYSEMMENAGNAMAGRIIAEYKPCAAAVLCGSGNNGGDGFVIALRLLERGFRVCVILMNGEPKTDCAREHFSKLPRNIVFEFSEDEEKCAAYVQNAEIVVECVFGTGFHGELPENAAGIFSIANERPVRIAADVPAGVDSDSGEFDGRCFKPTRTFMLAAMKMCVTVPDCRDLLGELELLDIGIAEECFPEYEAILTDESFRECLPKRSPTSHKGTFGRLLNIAGSLCYCGAAAMSTKAALRTGAGIVTLAAPVSVVKTLGGSVTESTFLPLPETEEGFVGEDSQKNIIGVLKKATAVCVGCGLGNSENSRKITEFVIGNADCPIIIDADGINSIADNINVLKGRAGAAVLTPHPMEFSRISGISVSEIQKDRVGAAKRFAREFGVIVVLKGANTVVTDGERVFLNTSGNPALAKGGSGDVLCGIIGGLLAQGADPLRAAVCGVYCHGYAADILAREMPQACVLAGDIIGALPRVFCSFK